MAWDSDLVRAVRLGFFLLPCRGAGGVTLTGRILRYDLELDPEERARLVAALLPDPDTHGVDPESAHSD